MSHSKVAAATQAPAKIVEEPETWGFPGDELLSFSSIEELLDDFLASADPGHLPITVEVVRFERDAIPRDIMAGRVLEYLLESLDEMYGDPDSSTKPTARMLAMEKRFIAGIVQQYRVWTMHPVERRTIVLDDWCMERYGGGS